jgi:hypothetical protein
LVRDIARRSPGLVPDVLAADEGRAWLLMADHGTPTRDTLSAAEQLDVFESVLPAYAQAQRDSLPIVDRWLAAGVPDRRVERLPALVDEVLAGSTWLGDLPLGAGARSSVGHARAAFVRVTDQLAGMPLAAAIEHSDLHAGNVLIGRGSPRIIDWGDACISHPFASLFVVFQHVVARLPGDRRRHAAFALRDAYLRAWTAHAGAGELQRTFAKAAWLGYVLRGLNFAHQMGAADADTCRRNVAEFLVRWAEKLPLLDDPDELVAAIADETEY